MAKANNPDAAQKKEMKHFAAAEQGARGTKDNSECATLRMGNMPKAEAVRTVKIDEGKTVRQVKKQNENDSVEGSENVKPVKATPYFKGNCK